MHRWVAKAFSTPPDQWLRGILYSLWRVTAWKRALGQEHFTFTTNAGAFICPLQGQVLLLLTTEAKERSVDVFFPIVYWHKGIFYSHWLPMQGQLLLLLRTHVDNLFLPKNTNVGTFFYYHWQHRGIFYSYWQWTGSLF